MVLQLTRFLLRLSPDWLGIRLIRTLAARTQRPRITEVQQHAMARADRLHYGPDGQHAAWVWGHGPLVVLVHGWNGRAAQLAPLALDIAQRGFRCVAIDITGHGSSPGQRTAWACFIDDIAALSQSLGQEVYAYVGHSAGGLAMMATRALKGIRAQRYVCICAPSHPFPPIDVIRARLRPRTSLLDLYKRHIARQFQASWEELERGRAYMEAGSDLLLFYDEADRLVAHGEGDRIQRLAPGARLTKTTPYGHTKVLSAPELAEAVGAFLLPHAGLARAA